MSFTDIAFLIKQYQYNANKHLKCLLPNYNLIKLTSELIQEMYNLPAFPFYQEKYLQIEKADSCQGCLCCCCFPCLLFLSCPFCPIYKHFDNKIEALNTQCDVMRQAFLQQARQMGELFQQKHPNYKFEIIERSIEIRVYHQDQDRQQQCKQENPFQIETIDQQTDQQNLRMALAQPLALKGGSSDFPEQSLQPAFQNNSFSINVQKGMELPQMPQQQQMPSKNYFNNVNNFNGNATGIITDEQAQTQFQKMIQKF